MCLIVQSSPMKAAFCKGFLLSLIAAAFLACTGPHLSTHQPTTEIKSLQGRDGQKTDALAITSIQAEVMRFADQYSAAVAQSVDDFRQHVPTPEARLAAQNWKLYQSTAAFINAANPSPIVNALDMVVLATLSRTVQESYWLGQYGSSARPLLETHQRLEREAWGLIETLLKPEQQQELRDLISEWRAKNPNQRYVAQTRLRDFAEAIGKLPPQGKMKRMPTLLSWQAELLSYQLATAPEVSQALAQAERLIKSTEVFAKTADQFPRLVNDQREAAIKQVFDSLATERTNLLASLAADDLKLRETLVQLRQSLEAGTELMKSSDATMKSLDMFMARFDKGTNAPTSVVTTNARPFDILDYAVTEKELTTTIKELNATINSLDRAVPQIEKTRENFESSGNRLLNRFFIIGAGLIALLLAGAVIAALAYRRLEGKPSCIESSAEATETRA
jgi:hypothetical protein